MDQWIIFFLSAIIETAKKQNTFRKIISLRRVYEQRIIKNGRKIKLMNDLLLRLFSNPAIRVSDVSNLLGKSISTSNNLIKEMEGMGILKEITGFSRNRIFILHEYLDIFRD